MGMPPKIIDLTTALDLIQQHVGCMLRERDEVVKPIERNPGHVAAEKLRRGSDQNIFGRLRHVAFFCRVARAFLPREPAIE